MVTITIDADEAGASNDEGQLRVRVQDNGIGIDQKHFDSIFDLFWRINKNAEGDGTGLAIVKRIIEAHGGRIWVESDGLGKGCCFCFTLGRILDR